MYVCSSSHLILLTIILLTLAISVHILSKWSRNFIELYLVYKLILPNITNAWCFTFSNRYPVVLYVCPYVCLADVNATEPSILIYLYLEPYDNNYRQAINILYLSLQYDTITRNIRRISINALCITRFQIVSTKCKLHLNFESFIDSSAL